MGRLLYIKANPKSDGESRTFQLSEHFIKIYQEVHPDDEIVTLDLYKEGIKPLTHEQVIAHHNGESVENRRIREYARQFQDADKFVIAAPLWNLGIPAILKEYIDYITLAGVNFCYTEEGPTGLCGGKKAVHITTRGGLYSEGPFANYEMGDRFLRSIFGFLGVVDFTTLAAEKLDIMGEDVAKIINEAKKRAENLARKF